MSSAQHSDGTHVEHHISPVSSYVKIFGALIFLTLLTIGAYQVHLGALNLVVAIVIATIKAAFVVVYFMHMKYEAKFNVLIFVSSILFGAIFLAYTLNDTANRAKVDEFNGATIDPERGTPAYGSYERE